MNKKELRINIKIDGRNYPLEINLEDEERYRKAAKLVNETVEKFRTLFQTMESRDLLAMSAFQVALNYVELENKQDKSNFIDELKNLNDDMSDFIKEIESA